jgi:integrase
MPRRNHIPAYRLHKQSGQAIVTLPDGLGGRRDFTLGEYGSQESRAEYARLLAEWEANCRRLPQSASPAPADISINELILEYWRWAGQHYRDEQGNPGRELENLGLSLRPLRQLYGHTSARQFGPLALRALQEEMAKAGLCRTTVNARINRIRRFFKWAVSYERLPAAVHQALKDVPGLQRGRGEVRESDPVGTAPVEVVEATLPFMPAPIAAMTRLQLLSGCRPGEAMRMRAVDLNMSSPVWEYRPAHHKNKHRGLERVIFLGAQAQEVIRPFLKTDLHAYLFSPREYVEALHARRARQRKTKRTPSELRRKRKTTPRRKPAERYDRRSYRLAILRAVDKANAERAKQGLPPLPPWSPLQLRHTAATIIRSKYGVEAARVILGHTKVETTQIYAERDLARAAQIVAEIG